MKLSSAPKPVKIRIMSGGRDHSSLESLREHFVLTDLAKNKTQVLRWLNTLGEEGKGIAESIKQSSSPFSPANINDVFATYKVFFEDYFSKKNIANIDDLVRIWCTQGKHKENCSSLLELCAKVKYTKSLLEAISNGIELNGELLQVVQNIEHPKVQYKLFQHYQKKQKPEEAKKHLHNAAILGSEEAIRETAEMLSYRKIAYAFAKKTCNNRNLMNVIFESSYDWEKGVDIDEFFAVLKGTGIDINRLDKDLLDVYFLCCCIMKKKTTIYEKLEEAEKVFGITTHISKSPSDRRGKRALFFLSLLAKRANHGLADTVLMRTKDDNYLSRFIYDVKTKTDTRFVNYKYIDTASFKNDFKDKSIRDFLMKNQNCSSDYQNIGPKRFDRLFNIYFMNTELLEEIK